MQSRPMLVIATGTPPPAIRARFGDYVGWFLHAMQWPRGLASVCRVDQGQQLPPPASVCGAVITGSAAMVSERLDWSERTAAWLRGALDSGLPIFGVCYGHQLLAHAMGGRVDYHPAGREIGTQRIDLLAPPDASLAALAGLPMSFSAHTTHLQSVLERPAVARVLARSAHDAHQILMYGPRVITTQFHPEFSSDNMRSHIRLRAATLRQEDVDVASLLAAVRPTPWARRLLRGFARTCLAAKGTQSMAAQDDPPSR